MVQSERPIKILFIVNSLRFFMSHRSALANSCSRQGWEVHVAAADEFGEFSLKDSDVKFHSVEAFRSKQIPFFSRIQILVQLFKIIMTVRPNVCHVVTLEAIFFFTILNVIFFRIPSVLAFAGFGRFFTTFAEKNRSLQKLLESVLSVVLRRGRYIAVVQNKSDLAHIKKLAPRLPVELIRGSGVNLRQFAWADYEVLPRSFGELKVLFASRLMVTKGILDFLAAASILMQKRTDIRMFVAGSFDTNNDDVIPNETMARYVDSGAVEYIGFCSCIPDLLRGIDVVCLPSVYGEGMPKVLLEAAAAGCIVVSTSTSGCAEAFIPGISGVLVPPNRPDKLAEILQKLASMPVDRLSEMGRAGRAIAVSEFDVSLVVKKHFEIYRRFVDDEERIDNLRR